MNKITIVERNPLMIMGIEAFLNDYMVNYIIDGFFEELNEALAFFKEDKEKGIIILGEFIDFMGVKDLIQWITSKNPNRQILAYLDKAQYVDVIGLVESGVTGVVWKSSHPIVLQRAIYTIGNGNKFLDYCTSDKEKTIKTKSSLNILTRREQQVLQLIAEGMQNKQIARDLNLSNKTIETHRLNLMRKLNVHSGIELLKVALKHGACSI